jgi:type I restriction enzyme M protein
MRSANSISDDIYNLEGFPVIFLDADGADASSKRVVEYPYQRAARGTWSVKQWKQDRFAAAYPEFNVEVIDPDGNVVHGRTLLDNIRQSWISAVEEEEGSYEEDDTDDVEPEVKTKLTAAPATRVAAGQSDIESWLWEAANILRGPVDPANLRDFVFPLLFLKRLSDTWQEEHQKAVTQWGDSLTDDIESDFHKFQIPEGCQWADVRRAAENHGVILQNIMQRIELANPDRLSQIFGNAPWADAQKMPPERLERLIEHFSLRNLSPSTVSNDLLGGGYEYLLKRFSDESATSAGQFFTPRAVVHLLVRVLGPESKDSVYDPACGSAGMLIEAATEVMQSGGKVNQMRFYGQEVNQTSAAIGRMNLLIHDVEDAQIRRDDTLRSPKFVSDKGKLEQFDVVVANPPFSLKDWGADKWATDPHRRALGGVPPSTKGDFAWVQHMIASMRPVKGRVGVVMPHGVLFRGSSEAAIRQHLIENDMLEAVVGLAPNLFYGTTIPACLLFFRATKDADRQGHVLFIDGAKRFTKGKNQNELSESDVEDMSAVYKSNGTVEKADIAARLVPHDEIAGNKWDLNIGRYLKTAAAEVVDVTMALAALDEARANLATAEQAMLERLKAAGYA